MNARNKRIRRENLLCVGLVLGQATTEGPFIEAPRELRDMEQLWEFFSDS